MATVGTSPLAPLLAILHVGPARVTLVASEQTENVAQRVRSALLEQGWDGDAVCILAVADAFDAREVGNALAGIELGRDPWFDISGGTKVLSAHAMRHAIAGGVPLERITSVDGRQLIGAGSGPATALAPKSKSGAAWNPSVDAILALHGLGAVPGHVMRDWPAPRETEPSNGVPTGGALECLVAKAATACGGADEVRKGVQLARLEEVDDVTSRFEPEFELDVIVRRAWRLSVISCGTHRDSRLKPWEVAVNARRAGGDQARAAVALHLTKHHGPELGDVATGQKISLAHMKRRVDKLGLRIGGASVEVFGKADIERWQDGNYRDLHTWLRAK